MSTRDRRRSTSPGGEVRRARRDDRGSARERSPRASQPAPEAQSKRAGTMAGKSSRGGAKRSEEGAFAALRWRRPSSGSADRGSRGPASRGLALVQQRLPRVLIPRRTDSGGERTVFGMAASRAVAFAVVLSCLVLTLTVPLRTFFTQQSQADQLAEQKQDIQNQIEELKERQAQQQDPAYIEQEARRRLGLVKPGEIAYKVQLPGAYEAEMDKLRRPAEAAPVWYSELWKSISHPTGVGW
ncbi:MAG: septum formation initiator family protein [Nocardiaceae bacterium]|nr:septum formation initiator family protein [Nocardiaceae bacterium]